MLEVIVTLFGLLMVSSYFPQARKIMKRKSSADVSLVSYALLLPGDAVWLIYGVSLNNYPLIITNLIATIGCVLVILMWFKFSS
jgi:MtN3 and saliva related transmembrane protein